MTAALGSMGRIEYACTMAIEQTFLGGVPVTVMTGPYDHETLVSSFTELDAMFRDNGYDLLLTIAWKTPPPDGKQRKFMAELIGNGAMSKQLKRHAMVTESMLIRGVMTALNWIRPKPYLEQAFADVHSAVAWLREDAPDIDEPEILAQLRGRLQTHPELRSLPDLARAGSSAVRAAGSTPQP